MTKPEIRARVLETIATLSPLAREEKSASIRDHILRDPAWKTALVVAFFASQSSEPNLDPLWSSLGEKRAVYPRVNSDSMEFIELSSLQDLTVARWNLREPAVDQTRRVSPDEIDLIFVPGIAFTETGKRLGRGGGFYDRLFAQPELTAVKIGLCFDAQLLPELPSESHDRAVDHVITESGRRSQP